jgi:hypothetical protein
MALAFGLLLITREGRTIVYLEMAFWLLLHASLQVRMRARPGRKVIAFSLTALLLLIGLAAPVLVLRQVNGKVYGAAIANSMEEGEFPRFYARLIAVRAADEGPPIPRVPLQKSTIAALLAEASEDSDSFALTASLRGLDESWQEPGCVLYPESCGEIVGGWFQWALRQSIADSLIEPASEKAFQRFSRQASAELARLCRSSETLSCHSHPFRYLPPPRKWLQRSTLDDLGHQFNVVVLQLLPPRLFPQGRPDYLNDNLSPPRTFEALGLSPLGTRAISASEAERWTRATEAASLIGAAAKGLLMGMTLFTLLSSLWRRSRRVLLDRPALWLFTSLLLHLSVYMLLGLTSFPGVLYVTMASPLYIGWMARLVAVQVV